MFSVTTMASSTTKPVEMVRAISERLSRLKPNRYITPKVPTSETGTAMPGINMVRESRRNTKTTRMTRTMEITRVRSTSWMEARMVVVRSMTTFRLMACGMEVLQLGHQRVNAVDRLDDIGARLAEDDEQHGGFAVGVPAVAHVLTESTTSPTSPTRTAAAL